MAQRKKNQPSSKPNPDKDNYGYARYASLAFEVVAFNLICIWGGMELSERYSPDTYWILIVSIILAVTGTIYFLLKKVAN